MRLVQLLGSEQENDIRSGKAPSDIFDGVARVKTYVKLQDVGWGVSPRDYEFDQPYQIGAQRLGCSWNEANLAVVFQAAGCNLSCDYCFVGEEGESVVVSPHEMVEVYNNYRKVVREAGGTPARVVRISGGEPFLQQEELAEVIRAPWPRDVLLWVDTNLTIEPTYELMEALFRGPDNCLGRVVVCGCFKPHLEQAATEHPGVTGLDRQRSIAQRLVGHSIECFFYWPCALQFPEDMESPDPIRWRGRALRACEFLQGVDKNAPLRTTFLRIKYYYHTLRLPTADVEWLDQLANEVWREMKEAQRCFIEENYDPSMYWQPSHLVPLLED